MNFSSHFILSKKKHKRTFRSVLKAKKERKYYFVIGLNNFKINTIKYVTLH